MIWLLLSIVIPFLSALACLVTSSRPVLNRYIGIGGSFLLLLASILLLGDVVRSDFVILQGGSWPAPFGITLVADIFSALMVAITGIVAVSISIYSLQDVDNALLKKHYFALLHFLLMGVNGAFLTGDLFNLYVWFEVMLIASFVLITLDGKCDQLEGGVKYLIINLLSSILFLSGVGLLYGKLGTLNMADIASRLAASQDALLINSSAMLLLAAFSIKAALFPFFFWLPASYHTPRVVISALFAGLLTKVGVYALIRSYTLIFSSHFSEVQGILLVLAAGTMISGVLGAAAQFNIRRILSFHIVSQIGYMVMGLAIGGTLAIAGAIFYIIHHIVVKTNLFLIGGLIAQRAGSGDLKKIGGLYKATPYLALLFLIPALSLGGIPPLSGFWAKFSVIKAGLDGEHYLLVTAALLVGILTLYSMTKIWNEAFWKEPVDGANAPSPERKLSLAAVIPCVFLAAITLILGFWSAPLLELSFAASEQLLNPERYIESVLNLTDHEDTIAMAE
ncbi:MAG: Na+/H+ antiporter subunit D [Puniceicoccaceae bacterium]